MYLNSTGYSIAAQDYVAAMKCANPNLDLRTEFYNQTHLGVSREKADFFTGMKKTVTAGQAILINHAIPYHYKRDPIYAKHAGVCLFEAINPPAAWVAKMNQMDMILAASQFNRKVFNKSGVKVPIAVIPHAFDTNMWHKDVQPCKSHGRKTVISIGAWKRRKNWEGLIAAFLDAFEEKDGVQMIVKTDRQQLMRQLIQRIKVDPRWRGKSVGPIKVDSREHCSYEEIPALMKQGDAYVSASLGEGFGLSGLHAMALGIPVVTPKFGGVLEYAKPGFALFVEPTRMQKLKSMDNFPQFADCWWPIIKSSDIAAKMRQAILEDQTEMVEKAYQHVHARFPYKVIGTQMIEAVRSCLHSS
jgi:glycosyltransferase involved in cell wall biosynthesis